MTYKTREEAYEAAIKFRTTRRNGRQLGAHGSRALLDEVVKSRDAVRVAALLIYHGFATDRKADRLAAWLA